QVTDEHAGGNRRGEYCVGTPALAWWKVVGEQRSTGWIGAGFANADTDARQKQRSEARSKTTQCRHQAPQRDSDCHDHAPVTSICQPGNGQTEYAIEQGKREPAEQRKL